MIAHCSAEGLITYCCDYCKFTTEAMLPTLGAAEYRLPRYWIGSSNSTSHYCNDRCLFEAKRAKAKTANFTPQPILAPIRISIWKRLESV